MAEILIRFNKLVWGVPMLLMIIGVGIYLTVRLGFVQITLFPAALKAFAGQFRPSENPTGRSSFQSLCTALAATVGTGNLVGVAGAICLGGPGSVFWMWICGILAMVTMALARKLPVFSIYGVSILGAAAHNVGQILAAMVLMHSVYIGAYLPYLLFVALFTGFATGAAGAGILKALSAGNISY